MNNPYFFGYGSLVNRATHTYPNAAHATAHGWQRAWVDTAGHPYATLTAVKAPGGQIDGLIAEVPNADWVALDEREHAYDRIPDTANIKHTHEYADDIAIYAVPKTSMLQSGPRSPILLSYLDVVLQGYLQEFGETGAQAFLETTNGWDVPVLNDRVAPIYPRHQLLSATQQQFVDAALATLSSTILQP